MFDTLPLNRHVTNEMDTTDDLLNLLKEVLVKPVVAGGAPRDWFFNQSCKDIDIFVDPQDVNELSNKLEEVISTPILLQTGDNLPEQYRSNYIVAVFSFRYKIHDFQIIVKNTTVHVLNHFPCSFSLISYEDFTLNPHPLFLQDMYTQNISFTKNCSQRYERKMIQKFPGRHVKYFNSLINLGVFS